MKCGWCGKGLEQRGHKPRLFCNASCRSKAWQQKRQQTFEERDRELSAAVQEMEAALGKIRRISRRDKERA